MKILHYRRHSLKGPDYLLTPEGIALAISEGIKAKEKIHQIFLPMGPKIWYNQGFHSPLTRTCQTLYGFASGLGYTPNLQPAITEFGTDELFAEFGTPAFHKAVESGASYFQAVLAVHDKTKVKEWDAMALAGVRKMFDAVADGEAAVAFGHSPIIELAAWTLCGSGLSKDNRDQLSEMEGIVFVMNDRGGIFVGDKIAVEK